MTVNGVWQTDMDKMSAMCVSYVESDIVRLSHRRRELLQELRHVEAAILEREDTLARVRATMGKGVPTKSVDPSQKELVATDIIPESYTHAAEDEAVESPHKKPSAKLSYLSKQASFESEHSEELSDPEGFAALLRDEIDMMLFSVDRSDAEEVVVYLVPPQDTPDIVTAHRAAVVNDALAVTRIGAYEWMVAFGAKVVPNHEREDPQIIELPEVGASADQGMADLVGAIEVPCAPDVIIDVWRLHVSEAVRVWATTTINGIAFCQLDRISLQSETHWGLSSVVKISLHGHHPYTGAETVEIIDMGGEGA